MAINDINLYKLVDAQVVYKTNKNILKNSNIMKISIVIYNTNLITLSAAS